MSDEHVRRAAGTYGAALSPAQRDRLRAGLLTELRSREITVVQTDVIYGTATRPAPAFPIAGS